ncbi:hypothetical protein ACP70R_026987 [Stipagrostis hirtigluma subsp. patula]
MLREPRAVASGPRDRLSGLPDGVLLSILSLLPARQAVQTSVLSRSWRLLWRSVPCLTVDERDLGVRPIPRTQAEAAELARFVDFATNLLSRRRISLPLDAFQLYARRRPASAPVHGWIRRGVECCPTVLDIEIPFAYPLTDDDDVHPFVFPHLGSSLFRRLKRLSLAYVGLAASFVEFLSCDCTALVDLELAHCSNYFRRIASATLEKLIIDTCYQLGDSEQPTVITAPNLESIMLRIRDDLDFPYGISVCDAAKLVKASICRTSQQGEEVYLCENGAGDDFPESLHNLIGCLLNVTSLELEGFRTMAIMLNGNSDKFPTFPNIRDLSLKRCFFWDESKLEDLGSFLVNFPCLEKLTLWRCMREWKWDWKSISLRRQDGKTFKCPKLKLIQVMYNEDYDSLPIELLWSIGRSLPDANITLTKVDI